MLVDQTGCKKLHLSYSSTSTSLLCKFCAFAHCFKYIFWVIFFSSGKIWWYFGSSADLSFLCFFSWLIFGIWIDRIAYFEQKPLIFSGVPQRKNQIKGFFMASLYLTKRSVCIQLGMQIRHLESCSNKFNFYFSTDLC